MPPERLLKALLQQALYSVRSETQLVEQINTDLCSEHFSVDGTMIESYASTKSFQPKEELPDAVSHGDDRSGGDVPNKSRGSSSDSTTTQNPKRSDSPPLKSRNPEVDFQDKSGPTRLIQFRTAQ